MYAQSLAIAVEGEEELTGVTLNSEKEAVLGDEVTGMLQEENGNKIRKTGKVVEIFSSEFLG